MLSASPLVDQVSAISCGIYDGAPVLDLDYDEDSTADTDANFVLTGSGGIVEIQATAERTPFDRETFDAMLELARAGCSKLFDLQKLAIS